MSGESIWGAQKTYGEDIQIKWKQGPHTEGVDGDISRVHLLTHQQVTRHMDGIWTCCLCRLWWHTNAYWYEEYSDSYASCISIYAMIMSILCLLPMHGYASFMPHQENTTLARPERPKRPKRPKRREVLWKLATYLPKTILVFERSSVPF